MADGIVTYGDRAPVDATLAQEQHAAYVAAISDAGWGIREVPHADELPDSAFVEDTVVVCGDLAVLTRPGAVERRAEVAGTEQVVRTLGLNVARIEEPGTLDGGDVLQVGTTLYVGRGGRTNAEGIRQLRRLVAAARLRRRPRPAAPGAAPEVGGHRSPGRHGDRRGPVAARHLAVPDDADRPGGGGVARDPARRGHGPDGSLGTELG